ncbi:MAG: hypothetical protein GY776_10130 [Alteromonas sp.]|nr:hypothetical protein [Alteromonas sp.]
MKNHKLDSYSIWEPIPGVCKSYVIMGQEGGTVFPLVYLRKPKHISQATYVKMVEKITLTLPEGFEVDSA